MKRILFVSMVLFVVNSAVSSQAPLAFNYQAVARNTSGELIINQNISVRISILTGSTTGATEYSETHSVTTDAFGVFNLIIGGGTILSGSFDAITWRTESKFLKIEADINGGTSYQPLATTQILSIPYALYANESGTKTFNDNEFSIIYAGGMAENPATAPTAVLAGMGGGNIDNGIHDYKVTFITSAGETSAGPASTGVTVTNNLTNGKILVSGIPVSGGSNVTARYVYRRFNISGDYKLLTTINDNNTTTYIDNIPNSSLGKVLPTTNSTTNRVQFDASGLTSNQVLKIPNTSGSLVIDEELSIPIESRIDRSLVLHGQGILQNMLNNNITFGAQSKEWGEAFISTNGRNNSVNINETYSIFSTDNYFPLNVYRNPVWEDFSSYPEGNFSSNAKFIVTTYTHGTDEDGNPPGSIVTINTEKQIYLETHTVEMYGSYNEAISTVELLTPFSNSFFCDMNYSLFGADASSQRDNIESVQLYINGALACQAWQHILIGDNVYNIEFEPGQIALIRNGTNSLDIYISKRFIKTITATSPYTVKFVVNAWNNYKIGGYAQMTVDNISLDANENMLNIISLNVPSGTFSLNISKSFGVPLFKNWEDGNNIIYRLNNLTEDSGWLNCNEICTFTPFTSEPTKITLQLIPKTASPTFGYPSIYGFYVTEF